MLAAFFGGWRIWAAAGLATLLLAGAAYVKGYADARARCSERELRQMIASQAATIERFRLGAEISARDESEMAAQAETAEAALAAYRDQLARQRAAQAALEAQAKIRAGALAAAEAEKGVLHAELESLRVRNADCRLDADDIAVNRRLLGASAPKR